MDTERKRNGVGKYSKHVKCDINDQFYYEQ